MPIQGRVTRPPNPKGRVEIDRGLKPNRTARGEVSHGKPGPGRSPYGFVMPVRTIYNSG